MKLFKRHPEPSWLAFPFFFSLGCLGDTQFCFRFRQSSGRRVSLHCLLDQFDKDLPVYLKVGKVAMWEGALALVALELVYSVTFDDILLLFAFGGAYCLSGFLRESPNAKDSVCEWDWLWSSCSGNDAVVNCDLRCAGGVALYSRYHYPFPVPAPQILLLYLLKQCTLGTLNLVFFWFQFASLDRNIEHKLTASWGNPAPSSQAAV